MSSKQEPTYEQAREQLLEIVKKLESGGITLDESLALWQRGEELAKIAEGFLQGAKERLDSGSTD